MWTRIIAIGGEPAAGKTTLMRRILSRRNDWRSFNYGLVKGHCTPDKQIFVLGIYNDHIFSGTDRLSMAVQPSLIRMIADFPEGLFVFEGDRLFNQSLFNAVPAEIHIIESNPVILKQRHQNRGDNQTQTFLKAKRTKIENIKRSNRVEIHQHHNDDDTDRISSIIWERINKLTDRATDATN